MIHHNGGAANPSATPGTEIIYPRDDGEAKRLAGLIREESMARLDGFDVDWVAGGDAGATYRLGRTDEDYFGIVREPGGVAVLAEMSYIGNADEAALLADPDFLDAEAQAIADGNQRWLKSADLGSGFVDPSYRLASPAGGGGSVGCVDPSLD